MADDRSVAAYVYDGGGLLESVTVENGTRDHAMTFVYDAAKRAASDTRDWRPTSDVTVTSDMNDP